MCAAFKDHGDNGIHDARCRLYSVIQGRWLYNISRNDMLPSVHVMMYNLNHAVDINIVFILKSIVL